MPGEDLSGEMGKVPAEISHVKQPEVLRTTDISSGVKVRTDVDDTFPVLTVPLLMANSRNKYKELDALAWKLPDGTWKKMTHEEYYDSVRICAKAFLKLGLERHHAVCILGFNSPEWFISDLGAIFAGGVATGIYTTNSPEACHHCCASSQANIVVVEDAKQLEKILQIRDRLPDLKAIVQYSGEPTHPDVISWENLMKLGAEQTDDELETVNKTIRANECCTLVYTSGTVGNPKAVMLSHDNLVYDAFAISRMLKLKESNEVVVSYLPLSHVAAQIVDIYLVMFVGGVIYFADKDALKGSLVNVLQEVQPTQFLGVPRVWEKIHEKMLAIGAQSGFVKKAISGWAKSHGLQHNLDKMNGCPSSSWGYSVASTLIFRKIKQALGLGRCEHFVSAAAPLSVEVKKYFMSLDIVILEAFGMSECSGAHIIGQNHAFRLDSVGRTITGLATRIDKPDADGNGELCMAGRHVFMGYLNDLDKTVETIDDEGWLHSGDIARVDANGFCYITGRIKELIITAGGENVAPIQIEHLVLAELPHISYAVLIGDKRKFLSILLTLKVEVDLETGAPMDTLLPATVNWLKELGCEGTTVTDVKANQDPKFRAAIEAVLAKVNNKAISNAQRVQKFAILPADFSIPTGELGPTLKVKRSVVAAKYANIIEDFYKEG